MTCSQGDDLLICHRQKMIVDIIISREIRHNLREKCLSGDLSRPWSRRESLCHWFHLKLSSEDVSKASFPQLSSLGWKQNPPQSRGSISLKRIECQSETIGSPFPVGVRVNSSIDFSSEHVDRCYFQKSRAIERKTRGRKFFLFFFSLSLSIRNRRSLLPFFFLQDNGVFLWKTRTSNSEAKFITI